jgi:hypothetical protein
VNTGNSSQRGLARTPSRAATCARAREAYLLQALPACSLPVGALTLAGERRAAGGGCGPAPRRPLLASDAGAVLAQQTGVTAIMAPKLTGLEQA